MTVTASEFHGLICLHLITISVFYHSSQFLSCSCLFAVNFNINLMTGSSILMYCSKTKKRKYWYPKFCSLSQLCGDWRLILIVGGFLNATFFLYIERKSNDDHYCMNIWRSTRTLKFSVILILKNYNLSFFKLLIIWNCADKGAEGFPVLSRWNKLHQILDRTDKY